MCWCAPSIRTPHCGRPSCIPPTSAVLSVGLERSVGAIELASRQRLLGPAMAKQVGWWVQFPPGDEVEKEIGFFIEDKQKLTFDHEVRRPHNILPAFVMEPAADQRPLDARPADDAAPVVATPLERRIEALERAVGQRVRMHGDFPCVVNGAELDAPWEILADPGMSYEFRVRHHTAEIAEAQKCRTPDDHKDDLFWHALNYRTAHVQHAEAAWAELEACVRRKVAAAASGRLSPTSEPRGGEPCPS